MKTVAIIPARGGSKGVPRKNVKILNEKPVIQYSIEQALSSKDINRVIVSTDDEEIAAIAREFGAEVPFLRPKELADDHIGDKPVFQHALQWLKNEENFIPDIVLNLRPTCPLRSILDIEAVVRKLQTGKYESVRSVTLVDGVHHPYWMFKENDGIAHGFVDGINIKDYYQRQLLPRALRLNGVVDGSLPDIIFSDQPIWGGVMGLVEIPQSRSYDIDTEDDFMFIEFLIKKNANTK